MSFKIGFPHLNAFIMRNDMLRPVIGPAEKYEKEKEYVDKLLTAKHEITILDETTCALLDDIIKKELAAWWQNSWYNVEIDTIRTEIMNHLRNILTKKNIKIQCENHQTFLIEFISDDEFETVQLIFDEVYRDFNLYYEYNASE